MEFEKEKFEKDPSASSGQEREKDESGYSEKQTDLDVEIKAGEWQNLRKNSRFVHMSRQGKIIMMHKAVTNRLNQLNALFYPLVGKHPRQGEKLLVQLRKLRLMQDYLLQCLVWEERGELEKGMVPDEVWKLIS